MADLLVTTSILTIALTTGLFFIFYKLVVQRSNKQEEIKKLIQEMVSQNSFLCENINNLDSNVSVLRDEVESVKNRNAELGAQIEIVRDILKNTIKE